MRQREGERGRGIEGGRERETKKERKSVSLPPKTRKKGILPRERDLYKCLKRPIKRRLKRPILVSERPISVSEEAGKIAEGTHAPKMSRMKQQAHTNTNREKGRERERKGEKERERER